tara:strand:- start:1081 stop:1494 length:414 start_codon:yes stop_codon:yes gene_type:complete
MENKRIITVSFPCSFVDKNDYSIKLSYNDAIQSCFIQGMLSTYKDFAGNNTDDSENIEIVIPKDLYLGLRGIDLKKLIDLWVGETEVYFHDTYKYNYITIYRVAQALLLNDKLGFMKELSEKYNEKDIENDLNIYNF